MTQTTTQPPDAGPRVTRDQVRDISRLRRASDQRMLGGVAEGLSRHLDIDPMLIRVTFGALTLFGGAGVALYALVWLTIPSESKYDSAVSRVLRRDPNRVAVAGLSVAAVVTVMTMIGAIGFNAPHPFPIVVVSLLAIVAFLLFSRRRDHSQPPAPPTHPPTSPSASVGGTQSSTTVQGDTRPTTDGEAATDTDAASPPSASSGAPAMPPPARDWWRRPGGPPGGGGGYSPPMPYLPPSPPSAREPRSHLFAITMGVVAIFLGIVWLLDEAVYDDMSPSVYPGVTLAVVAAALITGAWYGRSRLLIVVGVIAAALTIIATVAGPGPYGERIYRPHSATDLRGSYSNGVGHLVLHLEDIDDADSIEGRSVHLDQRVGQIEIVIPSSLAVTIDALVKHGEIHGPRSSEVTDLDQGGESITMSSAGDGATNLSIDINLQFGQIVISQVDCLTTGDTDPVPHGGLDTVSTQGADNAAACN